MQHQQNSASARGDERGTGEKYVSVAEAEFNKGNKQTVKEDKNICGCWLEEQGGNKKKMARGDKVKSKD